MYMCLKCDHGCLGHEGYCEFCQTPLQGWSNESTENMKEKIKRENSDFDFLKDDNWRWMYLDEHSKSNSSSRGYVSYRNFIVRALYKMNKSGGHSKEICKKELDGFFLKYNSFKTDNNPQIFKSKNFLNLFFYYEDFESKAIYPLVEDQTEGCYPLMIKIHKDRDDAFWFALNDVINNFDKIFDHISKQETWDQDLEISLNQFYSFDDPKSINNES